MEFNGFVVLSIYLQSHSRRFIGCPAIHTAAESAAGRTGRTVGTRCFGGKCSAGPVYLSICVTYYLWLNNRSLGYLALNVNNSNYLFNYRHSCACNLTIILTNQPTNQPSPQLNNAATSGVPSICCPITITCQLRPRGYVTSRHVARLHKQTKTHTRNLCPRSRAHHHQIKGATFPGSHDPRYCKLIMERSKHLLRPVQINDYA